MAIAIPAASWRCPSGELTVTTPASTIQCNTVPILIWFRALGGTMTQALPAMPYKMFLAHKRPPTPWLCNAPLPTYRRRNGIKAATMLPQGSRTTGGSQHNTRMQSADYARSLRSLPCELARGTDNGNRQTNGAYPSPHTRDDKQHNEPRSPH